MLGLSEFQEIFLKSSREPFSGKQLAQGPLIIRLTTNFVFSLPHTYTSHGRT